MSVKIISNVWDESRAEGSALLVMLALADHANDDGVSWPGVDRLAERARMDVRRTQRVVNQLVDTGELYVLRQSGRGHTNLYLVTLGHTEKTLLKVLTQRFGQSPDEARRLTYDILKKRDAEKVSPEPPFTGEKVASTAEKVACGAEKVVPDAEKVVETTEKGGPTTTRTVINRQLTATEPSENHAREAPDETECDIWDRARNELRLRLPRDTFRSWIDGATCHRTGIDAYRIYCQTQPQAEYLRARLNGRVADALAFAVGRPVTVTYAVSANAP